MRAAHYSLGDRWHDSGLPFVDQHFDKDISCCGRVSTEVVQQVETCSEKRGFVVAKRIRNWSFSRKVCGCWTTEVRHEKNRKNFSPQSDLFWSPSGQELLWLPPIEQVSIFPPKKSLTKQNIHLYFLFTFSHNFPQQWSFWSLCSNQKSLWSFQFIWGVKYCKISHGYCAQYCHLSPFCHFGKFNISCVVTRYSPYFQDLFYISAD